MLSLLTQWGISYSVIFVVARRLHVSYMLLIAHLCEVHICACILLTHLVWVITVLFSGIMLLSVQGLISVF